MNSSNEISPIKVTCAYTCANPDCGKEYEKRMFHCYNLDCCSMKCLNIAIKPHRDAQAKKEADERANRDRGGHIDYGGGDCH